MTYSKVTKPKMICVGFSPSGVKFMCESSNLSKRRSMRENLHRHWMKRGVYTIPITEAERQLYLKNSEPCYTATLALGDAAKAYAEAAADGRGFEALAKLQHAARMFAASERKDS